MYLYICTEYGNAPLHMHRIRQCTEYGNAPNTAMHRIRQYTEYGNTPNTAMHRIRHPLNSKHRFLLIQGHNLNFFYFISNYRITIHVA